MNVSQNKSKKKLLSTFEEAILIAIGDQNMHGWEIMKKINNSLGKGSEYSFGSLYPALFRLRNEGLLKSVLEEEQQEKGKKRNLYKVTEKGKDALSEVNAFRQNLLHNNSTNNDLVLQTI